MNRRLTLFPIGIQIKQVSTIFFYRGSIRNTFIEIHDIFFRELINSGCLVYTPLIDKSCQSSKPKVTVIIIKGNSNTLDMYFLN